MNVYHVLVVIAHVSFNAPYMIVVGVTGVHPFASYVNVYHVLSYTYVILALPSGLMNTCLASGVINPSLGTNAHVTYVSVVPLCVTVTVSLGVPSVVHV